MQLIDRRRSHIQAAHPFFLNLTRVGRKTTECADLTLIFNIQRDCRFSSAVSQNIRKVFHGLFFLLLVRIACPGDRHNVSYSGPLCGHTKGVPFAFDFAALLLELDLDVDT